MISKCLVVGLVLALVLPQGPKHNQFRLVRVGISSAFISFLSPFIPHPPPLHPQRKKEDHPVMVDNSPHESSRSSRGTKPFSHTPPHKTSVSPGSCPSSRQSPCYQSPSRRPHPQNPLNPAPSPAAAAPRSPALSPAPSHLLKGQERGERGEGQPPQDYPKSLEPGKSGLACFW